MPPATPQAVMAAIATKLTAGISGLRVYQPPRDDVAVPAGVVLWPTITFDTTFGRGSDRYDCPVVVLVGKTSDRASGAALQTYLKGDGSSSIKAVLEADPTLGGVVLTTRVTRADIESRTVAGVEYLAGNFNVEIYA